MFSPEPKCVSMMREKDSVQISPNEIGCANDIENEGYNGDADKEIQQRCNSIKYLSIHKRRFFAYKGEEIAY